MAWIRPRVWVDGPHITARQMNEISDSLRETAPAKAQAQGDLFYATGANAIARLPIGSGGDVLTPVDGIPAWRPTPTPITTQGDLVVGDADGDPSRFAAAGFDEGVLTIKNGELSWKKGQYLRNWWEHDEWWSTDSADDLTVTGPTTDPWAASNQINSGAILFNTNEFGPPINTARIGMNMLIARDITMSGFIDASSCNPCVIRARTIRLNGNTTIKSRWMSDAVVRRSIFLPAYAEEATLRSGSGGTGGTAPTYNGAFSSAMSGSNGGNGTTFCGGGGGGQSGEWAISVLGQGKRDGSSSSSRNGTGTITLSQIRRALLGRLAFHGGSGGRGGLSLFLNRDIIRTGHSSTASENPAFFPARRRVWWGLRDTHGTIDCAEWVHTHC